MRRLLLALLFLPALAWAQPLLPIIDGDKATMPSFFRDTGNRGTALGWWWWDGAAWQLEGGAITYAQMQSAWGNTLYHQRMTDELAAWWSASDKRAKAAEIKARYVTGQPCATTTDAAHKALCIEFAAYMLARKPSAAPASAAPEVWKVAPNSTYTTRPTYAWENGVRSTTAAAERVAVGAPCDPAVGKDSYRGVLSRADRVALCKAQ